MFSSTFSAVFAAPVRFFPTLGCSLVHSLSYTHALVSFCDLTSSVVYQAGYLFLPCFLLWPAIAIFRPGWRYWPVVLPADPFFSSFLVRDVHLSFSYHSLPFFSRVPLQILLYAWLRTSSSLLLFCLSSTTCSPQSMEYLFFAVACSSFFSSIVCLLGASRIVSVAIFPAFTSSWFFSFSLLVSSVTNLAGFYDRRSSALFMHIPFGTELRS